MKINVKKVVEIIEETLQEERNNLERNLESGNHPHNEVLNYRLEGWIEALEFVLNEIHLHDHWTTEGEE